MTVGLGVCFGYKYWGVLQGGDGWVVVPLFRVWVCRISSGCMLSGEVWWFGGELEAIGASRIFVSASLPPCSLRISAALCCVGVN